MIGDVFYGFQSFDDSPEEQFLAKVTVVDPADYNITADGTGSISIEPKEVPVAEEDAARARGGDKYYLQPVGDGMYRPVLLRELSGVGLLPGTRGGLISGPHILSQNGDCWIHENSHVTGDWHVYGNAKVYQSSLSGMGAAFGNARVVGCTMKTGGHISIQDADLSNVMIVGNKASMSFQGSMTMVQDSTFEIGHVDPINLSGCHLVEAHITQALEAVSVCTRWGWLSAYRQEDGSLRFQVGCQDRYDADQMRELADRFRASAVEKQMLEAWLAMVAVARTTWTPGPQSKSEEVVPPAEPAAEAASPFAEMAERARAVSTNFLGTRPPVPPPAQLDQYGTDTASDAAY